MFASDSLQSEMFGRHCARILKARYCSTPWSSSGHCWVPRDISAAVPLDPLLLVADEYAVLADRLQRTIVAELPKLAPNAELFFKMLVKERRFQPSVLLLMEKAMDVPTPTQASRHYADVSPIRIFSGQQCIPEIAEMSNIYNFVRHNMLDDADTRYQASFLNLFLGTKLSVLVGDFLLSKILVILASTKNSEVQSILSKVVEHLIMGEAMEITSSSEQLCSIAHYLEMVYYKKASLLANSCKAIAILAGKDEEITIMAFNYGRYLGYAYHLMDDILDIADISATSGNLSSDIASRMLGAPMLFAIEEFPELRRVVDCRFKNPSELEFGLECLRKSGGMQRTRKLATKYAGLALEAIETFPRTNNNKDAEVSRQVLVELARKII
ncbi:hypothetical protein AgCh_031815 [Apium graveolens]